MINQDLEILWIAVCTALVFLMQGGFTCLETGLTRSKNNINVAMKNLMDFVITMLVFWALGFAMMFGESASGLVGTNSFLFDTSDSPRATAYFLFQAMFCATAATIISGASAERMRFAGYAAVTVVVTLIIYPLFGHWAWSTGQAGGPPGWLAALGFVDFAGSTVVHSVGGWVALAAIIVLGPRKGRFDADGRPRAIPGSNQAVAVFGVMVLLFGWFGFNGGSTLGDMELVPRVVSNTVLAAASGVLGVLVLLLTAREPIGYTPPLTTYRDLVPFPPFETGRGVDVWVNLQIMFMPAIIGGLGTGAIIMRFLRSQMLEVMRQAFLTSSRYEYMFWDMAYSMESWPV